MTQMKGSLLLILLMLAGTIFPASLDGPAISVVSYDAIPDTLYPGSTGQLELRLENSGSEAAIGTTIYYDNNIEGSTNVYVGDIGAGSEALTTIPFKVPDNTASGIVVLTARIYYRNEDGTETKYSMASIPVEISQKQVLEVKTLSLSEETIRKGEKLTAKLEIINTGGVMRDVCISSADGSSFSLDGTTKLCLGDIPQDSSIDSSITISSSSDAEEGRYTIPLEVTYYDSLQNMYSELVYLGPVLIEDPSGLLKVSAEALSDGEIGSVLEYLIQVENLGASAQSATVVVGESEVFTMLGANTICLESIAPGEIRSQKVQLGVDSSSSSGYYVLPITIRTSGDSTDYDLGIHVQATPEIIITSENEASDGGVSTTLRIANSGNTIIRSLYVSAGETDSVSISGSAEKFIGTLNVDDFASFQFASSSRAPSASYSVPITIVFKDNDNAEHRLMREVAVEGAGSLLGAGSGSASAMPSNRGPGSAGFNPLLLGAVGIIVLGIGVFAYRRWRRKKDEA